MEPENKNDSLDPADQKNELIEQALLTPTKLPVKISGSVNSSSKYSIENYSKIKKLELVTTFSVPDTEIFAVRFDPEDQYLSLCTLDGIVKVYNLQTKKVVLNLVTSPLYTPATCLRWRPPTYNSQTKGVLLCGNSDGSISQWHLSTGKQLVKINEFDNQILALDYSEDGSMFASAGKDLKIRVYDEEAKTIKMTLQAIQWQSPGHNNRIFSLKFVNSDDPNTLISGGWDSNLHFWDLRTGRTYATILGPNLSGDAIDYRDGVVLTGSHRSKEYLQVWDYKTKKKIQDISWEFGYQSEGSYVYAAQFPKKGNDFIVVGSTGLNEAKLFDVKNGYKPIAKLGDLKKGIFTVDCANKGGKIALAGGEGVAYVLNFSD